MLPSGGSESGGADSPVPSMADAAIQESETAGFRRFRVADEDDDALKTSKRKRSAKCSATDKNGRGLRQFSTRVCEKVQSQGLTTYSKVADELVAEYQDPDDNMGSPDQQYDDKNIRRRVYDALNVLMAMDVISKDKKNIRWKGLPRTAFNEIEDLKAEFVGLKSRVDRKFEYLQELQDQYIGLQTLVERNERLYGSDNPSREVSLPFILVQTHPQATVELEISEDMQLMHFDFNSSPFELYDDTQVIKELRHGTGGTPAKNSRYEGGVPEQAEKPEFAAGLLATAPIPGILKGRVRHVR